MRNLCSGPGSCWGSLWGGVCEGISSTRSSPSCARACEATARCPRCGGLKVPPRMPRCIDRGLGPESGADVPVALDEVLEGAQLAQPDRPARVQLLRGVADLGPHPELPAIGEARGGVDVHA